MCFRKLPRFIISYVFGGAILIGLCGCASADKNSSTTTDSVSIETTVEETSAGDDSEESDNSDTELEQAPDLEEEVVNMPSLRDSVYNTMNCNLGAAVTGSEIDDPGVWDILTTHFATVTLGNELKPDALFDYSCTVAPGLTTDELDGHEIVVPTISYSRAEYILDKILEWNESHPDRTIKVRGHVLVWHSQTPEWFFHEDYDKTKDYVSSEVMNERLEWYIRTVLTHFTGEDSKYKDLFYGWDVVNEAISDATGTYRSDAENPSEPLSQDRHNNNSSWWHVYGSEEYIINAFKYANKYAPEELELYYNDYNECVVKKRNGIMALLEAVKSQEGEPGVGTRITAMGMQGHYGIDNPSFSDVQSSIEFYASIVGNVQITELDISASSDYDGSDEAKEAEYEKLRKRYNMLYFAMKAANEKDDVNVTGITFWGTVDKYSWLQSRSDVGGGNTSGLPQCPLLFDENYEPKSCFWVFAE